MRTCPIKDFGNLIPISHLLEIHLFHRSTGNNHTIVLLVTHLVEIGIERFHVLYRRILGGMALDLHKGDLYLKRCIRKQPHQVCFCRNLQRHQVQNYNPQRTDVLLRSTGSVNHENIFFLQ